MLKFLAFLARVLPALGKAFNEWQDRQARAARDAEVEEKVQDDARLSDVTAALEAERRASVVPLRLPDSPGGVLPLPRKGRRE